MTITGRSGPVVACQRPDPAEVKARAELMWDSLSSMEIVSEETVASADGRIDRTKPIHRYSIKYGSSGRWASEMVAPATDGRTFHIATFQDAHRLKEVTYDEDKILLIRESHLDANAGRYQGPPGILMTLLMPGNKSILDHIEDGATMEIGVDPQGKASVILRAESAGRPLEITIDPDHDWLASRVHLGSGEGSTYRVTRFDRDNGRWYPAEGVHERPDDARTNSPTLRAFEATTFRVNRPIADSSFSPPRPEEGTFLEDDIKKTSTRHAGSRGKPRPEVPVESRPPGGTPLVAGPPTSRAPIYLGLGAASALLLIWAVSRLARR